MKRELKYVWWKRNYFPHIILERPRGKNEIIVSLHFLVSAFRYSTIKKSFVHIVIFLKFSFGDHNTFSVFTYVF